MEKDKIEDYQKIMELPMIETEECFNKHIELVNEIQFETEYFKLIMQKLMNERN